MGEFGDDGSFATGDLLDDASGDPYASSHAPPRPTETLQTIEYKVWGSLDEAERALKKAAELSGFAVSRIRSANWSPTLGYRTRIVYGCYKGKKRPSGSKGLRACKSTREDCPWQGALVYYTGDRKPYMHQPGWRFSYVKDQKHHTHPMSSKASSIPANRRNNLNDEVIRDIKELFARNPEKKASQIGYEISQKHHGLDLDRKVVNNILLNERLRYRAAGIN
ncbi:hypothetical protein F5X96DRAFT_218869 [Biscogniauxia mediterranea]|nr:hypothetical protein F5X96DRAFT_218869 [Biscogniauxia mediterranea]